MPSLLNFDEFCEDLPEVTTIRILDKRKFHPEGLFSEQIFGPVKNYTCQCGTYYGISGAGGTCNICGVDVVNSDERRRRFAKIILPIPVINPLFYDLLIDIGGISIKDGINRLTKDENSVLYWHEEEEEFRVAASIEQAPSDTTTWNGTEAVRIMIETIADRLVEDDFIEWEIVKDNIDQLIIDQVIVLPPDLRPASKGVTKNQHNVDKVNRFYTQILTRKEVMENTNVDVRTDRNLYYTYSKQLQKDVNELYKHILDKLSKKEGLIRGNILGKRIDFSGRAVIVPSPTLRFDECYLPYTMVLELFKLKISKKLFELDKFKLLNDAIDFVNDCIEIKSPVLFNICKELVDGEVCLLNRQPSLHRLSMLGYYIKVSLDNVIKIHPLSCPPFNADFDGDQMAVYIPITKESKQEVIDKLLVTKNLVNPSNASLSTVPGQDMVLGIYALTNHLFPNLQTEVEYKGVQVTEDIKIFNNCFPDDYPVINEPVDASILIRMLNDINSRYPIDVTVRVLDDIKFIGFKFATLFGSTMSLDVCDIDGAQELKDKIYSGDNILDQLAQISSDTTEKFLKDNFGYSYMIESGARGSWDQARQIVLTRGFISNFKGHIVPEPIKSSFLDGLTPREFFNSTYGSRKGLLDVALNTGTSGYLSRKLIYTCANLQIDESLQDCGTQDLLEVHVRDLKKAKMLVGKNYQNFETGQLDSITKNNYRTFVGKTISIRSLIFCTSYKICCTCYGDLYKIMDTRFVGVVAAQSLGECNTQLVLRTFHTSGVAIIRTGEEEEENIGDIRQQDIVSDLSIVSALLHRFDKTTTPADLVDKLFTNYNQRRTIHHVHFECVVSQLMWHDIYKWRLLQNRNKYPPKFCSVQAVPSSESWLMGLSFSNPKKHIIKGILHPGLYKGVFDKILCGETV